ncbi:YoaK family protein [Williamsia sp.]|uniref:YoaK family protein n=1 Tax=Williamsia sp. TaxID=1872085 RepID=UPI001A19FF3E|nr:YoaK family protein [Williamsia sp.]MBJ7291464.1 DUF1275 domain-containing protein [Williamsia sp.]
MAREPRVVTSTTVRLGMLMAAVGGFLDVYTFVNRGGVFANAQTGNLIFLGIKASQGRWWDAAAHLPPVIAFVAGVMTAQYLTTTAARTWLRYPVRSVLVVEFVLLLAVGFVPSSERLSYGDELSTVVIAYAAAIQIAVFKTLVDVAYSTTMTTGNLKSMSIALYDWVVEHDSVARPHAVNLAAIIGSFLSGAVICAVSSPALGVHTVWLALPALGLALALFSYDEWSVRRR